MNDIYRCENCFYFRPLPVKQQEFGSYACLRYPPTLVPRDFSESGAVNYAGALVTVNHNWWCGEWKKK